MPRLVLLLHSLQLQGAMQLQQHRAQLPRWWQWQRQQHLRILQQQGSRSLQGLSQQW
jgi:hypothetical protein